MSLHALPPLLSFICAVSDLGTVSSCLLRSPDLIEQDPRLHLVLGANSAASAFNVIAADHAQTPWLVWVHEDVLLPKDWISSFECALIDAQQRWPALAVVGVYGTSLDHCHAGVVLDRGVQLSGEASLPSLARGLDEMVVAVRLSSGLRMDPLLGWDFYGSDLALQAIALGFQAAVVHAPCEHWSKTPRRGISEDLADRFLRSGRAFLSKWQSLVREAGHLSTPSVHITSEADLIRAVEHARGDGEAAVPQAAYSGLADTPLAPEQMHACLSGGMIEACWLDGSASLEPSDEEAGSALARFYRECGVRRFWHIGSGTAFHQRVALVNGFSRPWALFLTHKQCLISGSFAALIRQLDDQPKIYRAVNAHELSKHPLCPPIDYATGAGFESFSAVMKILPVSEAKFWAPSSMSITDAAYWILNCNGFAKGQRDAIIEMFCSGKSAFELTTQSLLLQDVYWPYSHCFHDYRHGERSEMIRFIPTECKRLLDWGGGEGGFAALASRELPGLSAWVAEIDEGAIRKALAKGLSILDNRLPIPPTLLGTFDLVAMLDSLEHTNNPALALRQVRSLLKPNGFLLLSVPHVGYSPVVQDLVRGRFEYEAVGPLCVTHRRFFSATGLRRLLNEEHFLILKWENSPFGDGTDKTSEGDVEVVDTQRIESFYILARVHG
jgi:SAM-dependent methyltransferase